MKKVMICGVDCKRGDEHCNGYCVGKSNDPPAATKEQIERAAQTAANEALRAAERAWHEYAALLDVGPKRTMAFQVFENIRTAGRVGS